MGNISDFEKMPKRGRLFEGDGLKSNDVNFKVVVNLLNNWESAGLVFVT